MANRLGAEWAGYRLIFTDSVCNPWLLEGRSQDLLGNPSWKLVELDKEKGGLAYWALESLASAILKEEVEVRKKEE